jgi:positive regulator of sigma E activity
MKLQSSAIVLVLSLILLIASAAGFTATADNSYLVIMVTAAIGGLAGLVMASEENREEREMLEFKQRLNNK